MKVRSPLPTCDFRELDSLEKWQLSLMSILLLRVQEENLPPKVKTKSYIKLQAL